MTTLNEGMKQEADLGPNAGLVGAADGRTRLATPSLLLDLDALEANLAEGARLVREAGLRLRPHFKAHKSLEVLRLQLEAGACGVAVATIGEAEAVAAAFPTTDILVTSILSSPIQLARAVAIFANRVPLTLAIDSRDQLKTLSQCLAGKNCQMNVLIDVDMGRGRSGCVTVSEAIKLAEMIEAEPNISLAGLQTYAGQLSHVTDLEKRSDTYEIFASRVVLFREALASHLPRPLKITGGSTGSMQLDLASGLLTELQCGSYAIMDVEYLPLHHRDGTWPFVPALSVLSTVLSANWDYHVTTDGGDKRFQNKYGHEPVIVRGAEPACRYKPVSDEHGRIDAPDGIPLPAVGDSVECIVSYCDPTINLYDAYHVVRDDALLAIWPIDGRGR
ncbi:alanine racemase [Breoghania sp.]|uniref:alanine racemase n=1 Tax=Breoghania sp. TaxID=2065378 RepID=UPI002602372B|nr:alanine racemase [Breoghania sp.]MDJ0930593.1 alanine racemase [Breoghania sp.]